MALTDVKVHAAKLDEKPHKLADSGNMFLLVHPGIYSRHDFKKVYQTAFVQQDSSAGSRTTS